MPVLTEVIQLALLDQIYLICDCLVFVKIIINSSPPKRAINPLSGMAEERRFAVSWSSWSPILCPKASLMTLNLFKSKKTRLFLVVEHWCNSTLD
ncbi:hypothetical protein [Bacillus atrophaeus]|uniref:hypothetical protein n=1 Tax=Bacillus atrophaeus TaxID=1452 RepID=UPI003EB8E2BD